MTDMNMNGFYGMNIGEYGLGSMMALMTEQEQEQEHQQPLSSERIVSTMPAPTSAFSSFSHGNVEAFLSAAGIFNGGGDLPHPHHHAKDFVGGHFSPRHLAPDEQAAVISVSSLTSVKAEGRSHHMDFHRNVGVRSSSPESSLPVRAHQFQSFQAQELEETSRMVTSMEVESACSSSPNDCMDAMKTKIAGHPYYPRLLAAYIECHKIGAPPQVVAVMEEIIQENQHGRHSPTISIGADPRLDQFMEVYCELLGKYRVELSKPFKEAMEFIKKLEAQLNSLSIEALRDCPPGYLDERGGSASSEEEFICGEIDLHGEDRGLKDQLLRKYSGYLGSLKKEFLKKKKKGKLPMEARQKLLDWWNLHSKWPYPSEKDKADLTESTGLDQKQINNWFINQRKRHWNPSDDVQFMFMDSLNPHTDSFYMDSAQE